MKQPLKHTRLPRPRGNNPSPPIVSLISLGCAKNTVDSECVLGNLVRSGLLIAEDPSNADVCLVNTCGFIHDARAEAAEVFGKLARLKTDGQLKAVVALGCLVEHVANCPEMASFLRQADTWVAFKDYVNLPTLCRELASSAPRAAARKAEPPAPAAPRRMPDSFMNFLASPRLRIGSPHTAYLKISEGCSNLCRFCSIPRIRGRQVSRPIEDILSEARTLVDSGVRELNLIAQDTTSYGTDLYGRRRLPELLHLLAGLDSAVWLRLLYAHPRFLGDDLLDVLAAGGNICPYIDLPLQHIADPMLAAMGRGMTKKETLVLLDRIAGKLPHGALRTTFIVGYPGETEEQFAELLAFVREGRFTHLGVFLYSHEPQTSAAGLDDDVPYLVKSRRRGALMMAQIEVSRARLKRRVGQDLEVMLDDFVMADGSAPAGVFAFGRTRLEAPEVDGLVYLRGSEPPDLAPGVRLQARVVKSFDYDLVAEPTA
ncbi:MAG: 30S ribosomal protein S12 methylthiotransferase RimO [Verrucomicrobiota bacterium]